MSCNAHKQTQEQCRCHRPVRPVPGTGQTGPHESARAWTGQTGQRLPEQPKAETKDITSLKNFTLS